MGRTKIEWAEMTWNPVTGCTKVSPGCKNCYAERTARRLAGRFGYPEAPNHFDVTLHPDRLEQPLRWRKPRMIFVCSMGDLFHKDVPFTFITDVFMNIAAAENHTFLILTKRPGRMRNYFEFWAQFLKVQQIRPLSNVWLGVSVENPNYLWRIEELMKCPAAVRFVSCEPLLEAIDIALYLNPRGMKKEHRPYTEVVSGRTLRGYTVAWERDGLDWVIIGGESGPGARPMRPQWARDIRDQCQAAGVPFFMKQMARREPIPNDLMIREYPSSSNSRRYTLLKKIYKGNSSTTTTT